MDPKRTDDPFPRAGATDPANPYGWWFADCPTWDSGSPGNASFVGQENGREEAETTAEPFARPMCFAILAVTGDTEQLILDRTGRTKLERSHAVIPDTKQNRRNERNDAARRRTYELERPRLPSTR